MPFDGDKFFEGGGNWPRTLNDVLKVLDIKPLSSSQLSYQKVREQHRHKPTFWYQRRYFVKSFLIGSGFAAFVSTWFFIDDMYPTIGLVMFGYFMMMIAMVFTPTKPPQWSEYRACYLTPTNKVPNDIIDKFDSIRKYLPSAMAKVGRLLDCNGNSLASYVAVIHGNTTAIIGFWKVTPISK